MGDVLSDLPSCPIWAIERGLPDGIRMLCAEGREDPSDGELALVVSPMGIRGVATLHRDDEHPNIEWGAPQAALIAAFGRALKRLGWNGARTLCDQIYAGAS